MFIGRSEELRIMQDTLSEQGTAIMIYGKRKVGKTTLIKEYLKNSETIAVYYECIKDTIEANSQGLTRELVRAGILPTELPFKTFSDIFAFVSSLQKRVCIVIDEYPYLKAVTKSEKVDSMFQQVIDNHLRNMNLIISGSHVGMMKDMLEEKNALYGRFRTVIKLTEMDYAESAAFYKGKSAYEKIAFYCVFGGSPYINEMLHPDASLKENIISTVLNEKNAVYLYADSLLLSDFSNRTNAEKIFSVLANGRKYYREIENALGISKNGNLHYQLKILTDMEIIIKNNPINRLTDAKKTMYEINDNLMRFYFSYIYKNKSALQMLGPEAFYEEYIEKTIIHFIAHRFESIVKTYFSKQVRSRELTGVRNIGTFYYDDPANRMNGEFDVVLEYENHLQVIEAKYYDHPMTAGEMRQEQAQVDSIPGKVEKKLGFAAASGFENTEGYDVCLSAEDLYRI